MIILKVLIAILVLLVLLLSVPVGVDVGYDERGLRVFIRAWRFTFCVFPRTPKQEKQPKQNQAETEEQKPNKKRGMPDVTKDEVLDAVSAVVRALKKLRPELYRLKLHFISAFDDPYQTAMVYGYANAGVQALGLPNRKHTDVQLGVDFERGSCYVDGYVSVTVRLYSIMKLCVSLIVGMIPILLRRRKRIKTIENNTAVKGKVA